MFKQLLAILNKGGLVNQAFLETLTMLEKTRTIFNEAVSSTLDGKKPEIDIYELDKKINDLEKSIRRKVLEHLSVNPSQDLSASLMLTSVIISIERIGDYSKNIYELLELFTDSEPVQIENSLKSSAQAISRMFDETKSMFESGNKEAAVLLMDKASPLKRECEGMIRDIANRRHVRARDAVANVLFARYLKRVVAHLENLASGVANPFDMIGFYQDSDTQEAD